MLVAGPIISLRFLEFGPVDCFRCRVAENVVYTPLRETFRPLQKISASNFPCSSSEGNASNWRLRFTCFGREYDELAFNVREYSPLFRRIPRPRSSDSATTHFPRISDHVEELFPRLTPISMHLKTTARYSR